MKRSYLIAGVAGLLLIIAAGVVWTEKIVQAEAARFIRRAVSAQSFSKGLEGGVVGRRECYPQGKQSQCTNITYEVGRATCTRMARESGFESTSSEGGDCGPVYGTVDYEGKVVNMFIGDSVQPGIYWVQAWVVD